MADRLNSRKIKDDLETAVLAIKNDIYKKSNVEFYLTKKLAFIWVIWHIFSQIKCYRVKESCYQSAIKQVCLPLFIEAYSDQIANLGN